MALNISCERAHNSNKNFLTEHQNLLPNAPEKIDAFIIPEIYFVWLENKK